jgi:hypothetical protein
MERSLPPIIRTRVSPSRHLTSTSGRRLDIAFGYLAHHGYSHFSCEVIALRVFARASAAERDPRAHRGQFRSIERSILHRSEER